MNVNLSVNANNLSDAELEAYLKASVKEFLDLSLPVLKHLDKHPPEIQALALISGVAIYLSNIATKLPPNKWAWMHKAMLKYSNVVFDIQREAVLEKSDKWRVDDRDNAFADYYKSVVTSRLEIIEGGIKNILTDIDMVDKLEDR